MRAPPRREVFLGRLQRGLELLYRIEIGLDVNDFVIDDATRASPATGRAPREQLLLREQDGGLDVALFLDQQALANVSAHDPRRCLDDRNLSDFLLIVEGVSHFLYVVWRARNARPVSALELELQGEVDKYATGLLTVWHQGGAAGAHWLRDRLFHGFVLAPDLGVSERERYEVANANARAYAGALDTRFVERGQLLELIDELRRFYRLGGQEKLAHIARAA